MTREEMQAALDGVKAAAHDQFPAAAARLAQLDSHLQTVGMVIDHLHDEDVRHQDGAN